MNQNINLLCQELFCFFEKKKKSSPANARNVWRLVALEIYNKKETLVNDQAGYTGNAFPLPPPPGP